MLNQYRNLFLISINSAMKLKIYYLAIFLLLISCSEDEDSPNLSNDYYFESFSEFKNALIDLSNTSPGTLNVNVYEELLDTLEARNQIPFVFGDSVAFLYYGENSSVSWAGDFNSWNPSSSGYQGTINRKTSKVYT